MTIDSEWFEVFAGDCPQAFLPGCAFTPEVGFIDGQIKLMAGGAETWDMLIMRHFVDPVQHLARLGAHTVVLAFDDPARVPKAKAMTQQKRRERLTPLDIAEWPAAPPQPWNAAMANSAFKRAVIAYLMLRIPSMLDLCNKTVILDWDGPFCHHIHCQSPSNWWIEFVTRDWALGEADVKFLMWARHFNQPMAVISIDGDYVPIALGLECDVCIFRKSWINIPTLRQFLRASHPELVFLIALTGSDFSRKLPWIKPKHLVESLLPHKHLIGPALAGDDNRGVRLVNALYDAKFKNKALIPAKIPPHPQLLCTLRNARFVLAYWTDPVAACAADPKQYGYLVAPSGAVTWDDTI